MRPVVQTLSAVGFTPWVPLDFRLTPFSVGLGVRLTPGAVLNYDVEHTFDDIFNRRQVAAALTRAAAVATLDFTTSHLLTTGDWIGVDNGGVPFDTDLGEVTVTDADTVTYPVLNTGLTAPSELYKVRIRTAKVFDHDFIVAQTASMDGNYSAPVRACRLRINTYTSGVAELTVVQSGW